MTGRLAKLGPRYRTPSTRARIGTAVVAMLAALISAFAVRATLVRDSDNSPAVPDAPPEDRVASPDATVPAGPLTERDSGPLDEGGSGPSPVARHRERSRAVVTSLIVAGLIVLLGFAPASRFTARGLPKAPARLFAVVAGVQHGTATAVRDVPVGLPRMRASGAPQTCFLTPLRRSGRRTPGR